MCSHLAVHGIFPQPAAPRAKNITRKSKPLPKSVVLITVKEKLVQMWIDCSIQTQKLEGILIFFPIAGFFLKMAANNQSSGRGVGKFTYQQQIVDSLTRGDLTHLILLEFNFSLAALCLDVDLSMERKKQRKQEKESAISSNRTLLGIGEVPYQKLRGTLYSRLFAVVTSGQGCCYSALHCRPSQT